MGMEIHGDQLIQRELMGLVVAKRDGGGRSDL